MSKYFKLFSNICMILLFEITRSVEKLKDRVWKQDTFNESYNNKSSVSENRCVAFRLDDVSDFKNTDIIIQIINTFQNKNSSLTLGVVGDRTGNDTKLIECITEKIGVDESSLEIANHGWKHEKFRFLDKEEQNILIKKTNEKIYKIFGVKPTVFIPPFNNFNPQTLKALKENNMTHISARFDTDRLRRYPMSNVDLYHFPQGTRTAKPDPKNPGLWISFSNNKVFDEILSSHDKYGFAVVTMHPYEYAVQQNGSLTNEINWEHIKQLELLLDKIKNNGFSIIAIGEINENGRPAKHIISDGEKK